MAIGTTEAPGQNGPSPEQILSNPEAYPNEVVQGAIAASQGGTSPPGGPAGGAATATPAPTPSTPPPPKPPESSQLGSYYANGKWYPTAMSPAEMKAASKDTGAIYKTTEGKIIATGQEHPNIEAAVESARQSQVAASVKQGAPEPPKTMTPAYKKQIETYLGDNIENILARVKANPESPEWAKLSTTQYSNLARAAGLSGDYGDIHNRILVQKRNQDMVEVNIQGGGGEYISKEEADAIKKENPNLYDTLIKHGINAYNDAVSGAIDNRTAANIKLVNLLSEKPTPKEAPKLAVVGRVMSLPIGADPIENFAKAHGLSLETARWYITQYASNPKAKVYDNLTSKSRAEVNNVVGNLPENGVPIIATSPSGEQAVYYLSASTVNELSKMSTDKQFEALQKLSIFPSDWTYSTKGKQGFIATAADQKQYEAQSKLSKYISSDGSMSLSNMTWYLRDHPGDTQTLKDAGYADKDIATAKETAKYIPAFDDFTEHYFSTKGWGTPKFASAEKGVDPHFIEANDAYNKQYTEAEQQKAGAKTLAGLLFVPAQKGLNPHGPSSWKDVTPLEWALGGTQLLGYATLGAGVGLSFASGTAAKVGPAIVGLAGKTTEYAAAPIMVLQTIKDWGSMTFAQKEMAGAFAFLASAPLAFEFTKGAIARIRPDVSTGSSLALDVDVGRPTLPKGMSNLAARELMQEVEILQLGGTLKANELRALQGVPDIDKVKITRLPGGNTDIKLVSADGKITGHVSGFQRVNGNTIFSAVPDAQKWIEAIRQNGIDEVRKTATPETKAILTQLERQGFVQKGYDALGRKVTPKVDAVLEEIRAKAYARIEDLGPGAHHGWFASPQFSQIFMIGDESTPAPGGLAVIVGDGEIKIPPREVLDSPNLTVMREKMESLAKSGKLDPGIYTLYKGYRDASGKLHLEYELYGSLGKKFYIPDSVWYSSGDIPKTSVTSLLNYNGPGQTIRAGDNIPLYWLETREALAQGKTMPTARQLYASKLFADLMAIRQYAPWNLRLRTAGSEETGLSTSSPIASKIKAIEYGEVPTDKSAGRVSALIRNNKGEILLVRQLGQQRYDLPGGGVAGKQGLFKKAETIDQAMRRETWEEVGLKPRSVDHVDTFTGRFEPGGPTRKFQVFEVDATGKPSVASEIAEYTWWDGKSKLKYPVADFAQEALQRAKVRNTMQDSAIAAKLVDDAVKNYKTNVEVAAKLGELDRQMTEFTNKSLEDAYRRGTLPYRPNSLSKVLTAERAFSASELTARANMPAYRAAALAKGREFMPISERNAAASERRPVTEEKKSIAEAKLTDQERRASAQEEEALAAEEKSGASEERAATTGENRPSERTKTRLEETARIIEKERITGKPSGYRNGGSGERGGGGGHGGSGGEEGGGEEGGGGGGDGGGSTGRIIIPSIGGDGREWTKEDIKSSVAWHQNPNLIIAVRAPGTNKGDLTTFSPKNLPRGLEVLKPVKGKGMARRSILLAEGKGFDTTIGMGAQKVLIKKPKKQMGARGTLDFISDPKQKLPVNIRMGPSPKLGRLGNLSRRQGRIFRTQTRHGNLLSRTPIRGR